MPNFKLFSWGANTYGQLGHGHNTDLLMPNEVNVADDIDLSTITKITGGGGHTIILTNKGEIYSCGWNIKGQLGIRIPCMQCETYRKLENSLNITYVKVCCGWDFTLAISDSCKLYAWGSNEFGQLGIENIKMSSCPANVDGLKTKNVVDIAAGLRFAIALTDDDEVWCWGTGKHGELGLQDAENKIIKKSEYPQKVFSMENKKIKSVICGAYHSAALSHNGMLYVWGRNNKGQLGKDPVTLPMSVLPQPIVIDNTKIMEIKSGWTHMICVTDSREVYCWGRQDYGQLGHNSISNSPYDYKQIKILDYLKNVVVGAEHNLLIKDRKVWSWGWNEHGICGTGNEENVLVPRIIESLSIYNPIIIGVGYGSSFLLVTEKQFEITFGNF